MTARETLSRAILAAGIGILGGCRPAPAPVEAPVVTIPARVCARAFATADDVPPEVIAAFREAAARYRAASARIRLELAPEGADVLDVAAEGSPRAAAIDFQFATASAQPVGATTRLEDGSPGGRARVTILPQRVPPGKLLRVVTHELGHSCGLEDLLEEHNVMTGEEPRNAPAVTRFGPADVLELRGKGY